MACWTNEDGFIGREVIGTGWLDEDDDKAGIIETLFVIELVESFEEDKVLNGGIYWA